MSARRIAGEDLEAVVRRLRNGESKAALAREYGTTPYQIRKAIESRDTQPAVGGSPACGDANPQPPSAAERETEHFIADEPPAPVRARVDHLDRKKARARKAAIPESKGSGSEPDAAPVAAASASADLRTAVTAARLDDDLAAVGAGVDDRGLLDSVLADAEFLYQRGKIGSQQYTNVLHTVLRAQREDAVQQHRAQSRRVLPLHGGGTNARRARRRPSPSDTSVSTDEDDRDARRGRPQLRGVARSKGSRVRAGRTGDGPVRGVDEQLAAPAAPVAAPPVAAPPKSAALAALLAYRGR